MPWSQMHEVNANAYQSQDAMTTCNGGNRINNLPTFLHRGCETKLEGELEHFVRGRKWMHAILSNGQLKMPVKLKLRNAHIWG